MKKYKKYLIGGKLGDLIHGLIICKYIYDSTGEKAILYIDNIGDSFETGLEFTYNELKPILYIQEWLHEFNIYDGSEIDMNLAEFRNSKLLYKTGWNEIYFDHFLEYYSIPTNYKWINMTTDSSYSDTIIINRSLKPLDSKTISMYDYILNEYNGENIVFLCFDEIQYDNFPFKDKCKLVKVNTLYDFFQKIHSCKLFIGNQSGPTAWATSMNILRITELLDAPDYIHYINDSKYTTTATFF